MIILFANQKGGCGKTTNCIQFANYLSDKGVDLVVLDLDFQKSIIDRREEDLETFDNKPLYEVMYREINEVSSFLKDFEKSGGGNLLIDLPGKIDDDDMEAILRKADVIICPFKYDRLTMDSTSLFIKILDYLKIEAKLFFVPNSIKKSVKYEIKEQVVGILNTYGMVTPEVSERVAMERVNTLLITDEAKEIVKETYDFIIKKSQITK